MRYVYKAVWSLDGFSLPESTPLVELYRSDGIRFSLASIEVASQQLADTDKASAVLSLFYQGLIRSDNTSNPTEQIAAEIEKLNFNRLKKATSREVLILEATGDPCVEAPTPKLERDDYVIAYVEVNKGAIAHSHARQVEKMKLAIARGTSSTSRFTMLCDGLYLQNDSMKVLYPYYHFPPSPPTNVRLTGELTTRHADNIDLIYRKMLEEDDLESVERLFSEMTKHENGGLKTFIFGWTALEILIAKSFKDYEDVFLSPLTEGGQPSLRGKFLDRIKSVMKDKYRLGDKFMAVTSVLFPHISEAEAQRNYRRFFELKRLRDCILHGERFNEQGLPILELSDLLRSYIDAHLKSPIRPSK